MADSKNMSKLERLTSDKYTFRILLEGALKDWDNAYNVLDEETNEYVFDNKLAFNDFSRRFQENPEGRDLFEEYYHAFSRQVARNTQNPDNYFSVSHLRLKSAAVPIFSGDEHIGTVFFGQARPEDMSDDFVPDRVKEYDEQFSQQYDYESGELIRLYQEIPHVSDGAFQQARQRVQAVIQYVSRLEHSLRKEEQRRRISEKLEWAAQLLAELTYDIPTFWGEVARVLDVITPMVSSRCSMILEADLDEKGNEKLTVRAVAGLPEKHFIGRMYDYYVKSLHYVVKGGANRYIDIFESEATNENKISGSIRKFAPQKAKKLNKAILLRIRLDSRPVETGGILIFFVDEDEPQGRLSLDERGDVLSQLAALIGTAHHNTSLYVRQQRWISQVTHQLLSPLNGLMGYAQNHLYYFQRWQEQNDSRLMGWEQNDIEKWENSLESMIHTSEYSTRLARNLAWKVYVDDRLRHSLSLRLYDDLSELLIASVRNLQGIAHQRGLRTISVDVDSVKPLHNRLKIDREFFRQALENLLDNAVKYSDRDTDVLISGRTDNQFGYIDVVNTGLRLDEDDIHHIFRDGYRTPLAEQSAAVGTGTGLTVSKDIINLHHGEIIARPSKKTKTGQWETTFTIKLPLFEQELLTDEKTNIDDR